MNLYPIITTPSPAECRDFYVKLLGARLLFQTEWYVHIRLKNWEIGFLKPNPPQKLPVFQHARPSHGLTFALEVPDVRAVYKQLVARGAETLGKPEEFANGEIAFSIVDPAGTILNLVEIRPETSEVIQL